MPTEVEFTRRWEQAAVASALNAHAQAYLGKETTATVYAVELLGGDDWRRNGYKVEPRKSSDIQTVKQCSRL